MRAFIFGVLLVACGGEAPGSAMDSAAAGSSGEASVVSEGGSAGALSASSAGASSDAGGMSRGGAPGYAGGGSGGQADAVSAGAGGGSAGSPTALGGAPGAGSGGAPAAGSASVAGGGSVSVGGSAGAVATGDPLAPFPAPGCPEFTAYRVPRGNYLAITSGDFESRSIKNGVCVELTGEPHYDRCATASNVNQCVCTVTSPPTCGQYCDGEYVLIAIRAKPGDTLQIKLHDGNGACVAGVPTRIPS